MKKIILSICISFFANAVLFAQAPQGINYQAVARDAAGNVLANQNINVFFAVLDAPGGSSLYSETHTVGTNQFGLFNVVLGQGINLDGPFTSINWALGDKFLNVKIDPAGGSSFIDMGTTQLVSVPFALYAEKSGDKVFTRVGNVVSNGSNVATDNFVFGSSSLDNLAGTTDDARFFFNKQKGAFRAGIANIQWNNDSLGIGSFASGFGNRAKGNYSAAFGYNTNAYGNCGSAFGIGTVSADYYMAVGRYNKETVILPGFDAAFVVGNGISASQRSNAFEVWSNGTVRIGNKGSLFGNLQEGMAIAGNSNSITKEYTIVFPNPFDNVNNVRINVQAVNESPVEDQFLVTVKQITNSQAVVIVRRMDGPTSWGQQLRLHWMAWE